MMYVAGRLGLGLLRSTATAGKKGAIRWKMDPGTDRAWGRRPVACLAASTNRGVALWKDQGDLDRAGRPDVRHQQGDRRGRVGTQDCRSRDWRKP